MDAKGLEGLARLAVALRPNQMPAVANAAEILREAILSGALERGSLLRVEDIAVGLGISLDEARETVQSLEAQGLVEFFPSKGGVVAPFSADEIEELFEIRIALETLALRRSIPKLTAEALDLAASYFEKMQHAEKIGDYLELHRRFHMVLYASGCSEHLLHLVEKEFEAAQRYLRFEKAEFDVLAADQEEHRALLEACRARDVEAAVRIIVPHIAKTKYSLAARLRSQTAP